jgi:hypothetical protein
MATALAEPMAHNSTAPLAAVYEALNPYLASSDEKTRLTGYKLWGLFTGYHVRWFDEFRYFRINHIERTLAADLVNPETGRISRSFVGAGKLDVEAKDLRTSRLVAFDHKTTQEDITDPNSSYWRALVMDGQVSHYLLLKAQHGEKCDYAMWDVMRKPAITPRQFKVKTPKGTWTSDFESLRRTKNYFGFEIDEADIEEVRETEKESLPMYAARLAEDCSSVRPQWYFQRRQIPRMDERLANHAKNVWGTSQLILNDRKAGFWAQHPRSCMAYKTPCKFLGICSGYDSPESGKWIRREWIHPELPIIDGLNGRDVLTNSRIAIYQECPRKHYFQYELGLERADEEEREALVFGSLFHLVLEAYFRETQHLQQKGAI